MRVSRVIACMVLATVVISAQQKPPSSTAPLDPPGIVISEVLFDPRPGDSAFIELLNTAKTAADLSRLAVRAGDAELSLIRVTQPLAPGARLLVRFDGQGRVEGLTLHAPAKVDLARTSGRVALVNGLAETVDAVAWGDEDSAVDTDTGSGAEPAPGRTIGRPPGMTEPLDLRQWVLYTPAEATPGRENRLPRVSTLVPFSGSVVKAPLTLQWYPSTGAVSYRVQLAAEPTFSKPLLDRTVNTTTIDAGPLPNGPYVWRVQSIDGAGNAAAFSDLSSIEVDSAIFATAASVPQFALKVQARTLPPGTQGPDLKLLDVALIKQHKDTRMLQLENPKERDPHGWDVDHQDLGQDPSDLYNCVNASVAMINHYYGGDLSQDRIGYEVRSRNAQRYVAAVSQSPRFTPAQVQRHLRERQPGPEWDLNYGDGLVGGQIAAAIAFAFTRRGAPIDASRVGVVGSWNDADEIWKRIKAEIDNNRPLIDSYGAPGGTRHATVIDGWRIKNGQRQLRVVNPMGTITALNLDVMSQAELAKHIFFFLPQNPAGRQQEPELTRNVDTDADGVLDFDEIERFHTDPKKMDTDDDGVLDKEDIASGVFDPMYGYARHNTSTRGRDFDGDTKPTELDRDSDEGGCRDGIEDADADGHRNGRESWNFEDADDLCNEINGRIVFVEEWRVGVGETKSEMTMFRNARMSVTVKLKPETPGEMGPLLDNGSSYRFSAVGVLELPALKANGCHPISRGTGGGAGRFDHPGTDMGGNHDGDTIVIGAQGDGMGTHHTDMCVFSGSSRSETSMTLPSCEGKREVTAAAAYVFNCTTPPVMPPNGGMDFVATTWSMTGRVRVGGPDPHPLASALFGRPGKTLSLQVDRSGSLRLGRR